MIRFIIARLLQSVLVMVCVYTATFWLLMAAPGDPFIGPSERKPPASVVETLKKRYMVDQPVKAYFVYAYRVVCQGDFGPTISSQNFTVNEMIRAALPVSVALGSLALVMSLWLGLLAGLAGAVWKGRAPDIGLAVLTLFGVSLPNFILGSLILMAFSILLPLFPSGGWGTVRQLVLPAITLSLFYLAYIARLTRASVLDVLSADYVRTARAKGLPPHRVIGVHVMRNATLPILSFLGPAAATILTGSFVVEKIFAIPGLGAHFVNACLYPDMPLVLGTVLVYTAMIVVFNFLVDIAYLAADPRISLQ